MTGVELDAGLQLEVLEQEQVDDVLDMTNHREGPDAELHVDLDLACRAVDILGEAEVDFFDDVVKTTVCAPKACEIFTPM